MKTFLAAVVALVLGAALNAPWPVRAAPADVTGEGRQFVQLLAQADFAGAVTQFDDSMKAALPAAKLRELWQTLVAQDGPFQKQLGVRESTSDGYDIALVTCQFERVAGLFFLPSQGSVSDYPAYAPTNTFHEREFTVGHGEWQLPGTLTLPGTGTGPWPAVVLVHGSGPEDRDETGGANKPFRDLAWGLAARGVAVLRYEKRTREYAARFQENYPAHFTVREETVADALSAVAQLRQTREIDPRRIFVLGHSLGGMLAPQIGQADTNLAGLILLAGPSRPFAEMIVEQTRYLISLHGAPSAADAAYLARVQADAGRLKNLTVAEESSTDIIFGARPAYWLDLRGYDPLATAKRLSQPLLLLQGGRDYQVTRADFSRWQAALGARPGATFKFYPALNHQFIAGEGPGTPAEYGVPGHVAEPVVADLAGWIRRH